MGEAKSYFFCGIGGSGMLPLALIVRGRGDRVAGSDRTLDQGRLAPKFDFLASRGIALFPQDGSGITSPDQIVVASAAIEETVPDIVKAKQVGARRLGRPELLAELFNAAATGIAVGGTSGKSTVTGMIGWILHAAGRDPTVMNGAVMKNFVSADLPFASALVGGGGDFVSEVDESDGSIALYRPKIAVLNNISLDHKSLDELRHLFRDFATKAETVVLNLDDDETRDISASLSADHLITYSLRDPKANLFGTDVVEAQFAISFGVRRRDTHVRVHLRVPGRHNAENALAALAAAEAVGIPLASAASALADFRGVGRRFELVGTRGDVTIIDDFAHNPVKIAATLRTLHAFPGRVLIFFQPHGYGPLRAMKDELIHCFAAEMMPDDILIMPDPVFYGGTTSREVGSADIVAGVRASGRSAEYIPDRASCGARLQELADRNDRIVVMGARDDTLSQFALQLLSLGVVDPPQDEIPTGQLQPRPSPVDALVSDEQLRLVDATPVKTETAPADIEAARRTHLGTANRLCDSLAGSNVGPGFNARLENARRILSRKLTRERSLQLALHVRGLEGMITAISERLDNVTVADVSIFVGDLNELVRQFPNYRQFVDEALTFEPIDSEVRGIATELALQITAQPDAVVEPELKQAIADVQASVDEQPDKVASLALLRTIGNVFRAIGRSIIGHLNAIATEAGQTFDKTVGKAGGKALALLVVGPSLWLLMRLHAALPAEFRFVEQVIRAAKALLEGLAGLL